MTPAPRRGILSSLSMGSPAWWNRLAATMVREVPESGRALHFRVDAPYLNVTVIGGAGEEERLSRHSQALTSLADSTGGVVGSGDEAA